MSSFKSLKLDPVKCDEGVDLEYENTGMIFRIARMGNRAYDQEVRRLTALKKKKARFEELSPEELDEISQIAVSKHVLKWWSDNIEEGPYSPELALEMIKDESLFHWYKWVVIQSNTIKNYRCEDLDDAAKNLSSASDGTANSEDISEH